MRKIVLFALLAVMVFASNNILITTHKDELSSAEEKQIGSIFLGRYGNWQDGTKVIVGYVSADQSKAEEFFKEYTGHTLKRYQKYWVKRVFSGYGIAPKVFKNAKEAIDFVQNTPGAVVFVPSSDQAKVNGVEFVVIN